jgi:hypothetical protein
MLILARQPMSLQISTTKCPKVIPPLKQPLPSITDESTAHAARFLKEMHDRKEIEGKNSGEYWQTDLLQPLEQ